MASITTIDDLTPEVDAAVRAAVANEFPDRDARIRLCASEQEHDIVRVLLPVPKLHPPPFVIYAIDRRTQKVKRLQGDAAKPYLIANYK